MDGTGMVSGRAFDIVTRTSRRKRRAKWTEFAALTAPHAIVSRVLLLAWLALTPLAFSRLTLEAFEFPKALLTVAFAILLVGHGLAWLALAEAPARAARVRLREAARDPLAAGVAAFVASAAASTVSSISPLTSLLGDHESFGGLATVLALATLFFAARFLATDVGAGYSLLAAPVLPASAAAVYALVQAAGNDPIAWGGTASFSGLTRVFATLGHPNLLGAYLAMTAPLTAVLAVSALRRGRPVSGSVLLAAVLLQVAVAVVTSSRAAWLAVTVSAVLLAAGWFRAGTRRAALAILAMPMLAALLLAGAALLPPGPGLLASLGERARRIVESPSRREIWRTAVAIQGDHFWLGSGLDTFRLAFSPRRTTAYAEVEWNTTPNHAHNGALQVLATQGLVGAAALSFLATALAWRLFRLLQEESGQARDSALALGAALAAFATASAFGGTSPATAGLAAVLAGTLSGMRAPPDGRERRQTRDLDLAVSLAAVAAAALFALNAPTLRGGLGLVLTVLAPALAAFLAVRAGMRACLQVPDRESPAEGAPPRRSERARAPSRRARVARVGAWMLAAGALLPVLRWLAADQEARRGLALAPRDPEAAIAEHRRSVALVPWREVLWLRLGTTSHAAGVASGSPEAARARLGLARQAFERAVALAPKDPYAHMRLAGTLAELARSGQVAGAEAVARADQALLLDPNNPLFYVAAVNIALVAGDTSRAQAYAQRCLERHPRFAAPRYLLGRIALQEGRTEEAVREMEAALQAEWHGDSATREYVAGELERARTRLGREQSSAHARGEPGGVRGAGPE